MNDGVAFQMTELHAAQNVRRPLVNRPAIWDLPSAVSPTGVAFSLVLLATQVPPKVAALGLVGTHMLVKRLLPHLQTACDQCGAEFQSQQGTRLFFNPGCYRERIACFLRTFNRQFTGSLWTVAARARIEAQLAANGRLVTPNRAGNSRDAVLGFHKAGNLITFNLAAVLVIHRTASTCRSRSLEC